MRRCLPWLLALPVMATGSLAAHSRVAVIAAILIGLHLAVTALAAALFPRAGQPSGLAAPKALT